LYILTFGCLQVLKLDDSDSRLQYFVHYIGWNSRHDEWIERDAIIGLASATPAHPGRTPKRLTKVKKVNGFYQRNLTVLYYTVRVSLEECMQY